MDRIVYIVCHCDSVKSEFSFTIFYTKLRSTLMLMLCECALFFLFSSSYNQSVWLATTVRGQRREVSGRITRTGDLAGNDNARNRLKKWYGMSLIYRPRLYQIDIWDCLQLWAALRLKRLNTFLQESEGLLEPGVVARPAVRAGRFFSKPLRKQCPHTQ